MKGAHLLQSGKPAKPPSHWCLVHKSHFFQDVISIQVGYGGPGPHCSSSMPFGWKWADGERGLDQIDLASRNGGCLPAYEPLLSRQELQVDSAGPDWLCLMLSALPAHASKSGMLASSGSLFT